MSRKITNIKVIEQANTYPTGSIIFFHGSGDTGEGFFDWLNSLLRKRKLFFPHLRLIFPTAPVRPYEAAGGELRHVWFNRYDISQDSSEDLESLNEIIDDVNEILDIEVNQHNIPLNRIVIGGFSMGGALALHNAYRCNQNIKGVFALSSFLNENSLVYKELENSTNDLPLLFMRHGTLDQLIPLQWGQDTYNKLTSLRVRGEFKPVKDIFHEMTTSELNQLFEWFDKLLPENFAQ